MHQNTNGPRVVTVATLLLAACGSAPPPAPQATTPPASPAEPTHAYLIDAPVELAPEAFDETAGWRLHIRPETDLVLWEGGATVRSCWMTDVPVFQANAETTVARVEGPTVDYFVQIPRRILAANTIIAGAVMRSAEGTPFGWLVPGTILEVYDLIDAAESQATFCLDGPTCGLTGVVQLSQLGVFFRRAEDLRPPHAPSPSETLRFQEPMSVTLRSEDGVPLAEVETDSVGVIGRTPTRIEAVLPLRRDARGGAPFRAFRGEERPGQSMGAVFGFIDLESLPSAPPPDMHGGLLSSLRTRENAPPSDTLYVREGAWIYGTADESSRMARVARGALQLAGTAPPGAEVFEAQMATPWGNHSVFVRAADLVPRPEGQQTIVGTQFANDACLPANP